MEKGSAGSAFLNIANRNKVAHSPIVIPIKQANTVVISNNAARATKRL